VARSVCGLLGGGGGGGGTAAGGGVAAGGVVAAAGGFTGRGCLRLALRPTRALPSLGSAAASTSTGVRTAGAALVVVVAVAVVVVVACARRPFDSSPDDRVSSEIASPTPNPSRHSSSPTTSG
jgi:hypothetical protein